MAAPQTEITSHRLDVSALARKVERRQRQQLAWALPLQFVLAAVVLVALCVSEVVSVGSLKFSIPVVLVAFGIGLLGTLRAHRRQRPVWESYRLTLGEHVMRRSVATLPTMELLRTEVTRIFDAPSEGLTVATADASRFIFIPAELEGLARVRERLAAWATFEAPAGASGAAGITLAKQLGAAALLVALWIGSGVIPSIFLALAVGAALLVVAGLAMAQTLRSPNIDNRSKARAVGALSFMMLSPFARAILHFGFHMEVKWPT